MICDKFFGDRLKVVKFVGGGRKLVVSIDKVRRH